MAFQLSVCPWTYVAQYTQDEAWEGEYTEKPHLSPKEEENLPPAERDSLLRSRNSFSNLPLVNYTTQYAVGCFEGLKAFPQPDNSFKLFRADENAKRMRTSMRGLMMPPFPDTTFVEVMRKLVARNQELGFCPDYDPSWRKDDFQHAHAVYLRPFSYTEAGIGLNLSQNPWFVCVCTTVGSYFQNMQRSGAVTTDKIRATRGGTGWMKCTANYLIPILEKKRVEKEGFMEVIFLDAETQQYVEEGSSCNIFFYMKDGTLITPPLGDRILPGITRKSIITLAQDMQVPVFEKKISIEAALSDAQEAFVTGTAAGVTHIASLQHGTRKTVYNKGAIGELSRKLQSTLKQIQYGLLEDKHGWMLGLT